MKLTVGRIVHVYRVSDRHDGVEKQGPYAGIVVGVNGSGAVIRVLHQRSCEFDALHFMDTNENTVYRLNTTDEAGWLWCWPPRE